MAIRLLLNVEQNGMRSDFIKELQEALIEEGIVDELKSIRGVYMRRLILRIMKRLFHYIPAISTGGLSKDEQRNNIATICGGDFAYCTPEFLFSAHNFLYVWDGWPYFMPVFLKFARMLNVETIFFSAKQSAEVFNALSRRQPVGVWLPEGINAQDYCWRTAGTKDIDVIEFGRRYDRFHEKVRTRFHQLGVSHVYSDRCITKLRSKAELCDALARAKISICFPSALTHPQRLDGISTMTLRYLQSMISKCLVVGSMPDDMRNHFDYKPVIEIDLSDPVSHIVEILRNYEDYLPLVQMNYEEVLNKHLWKHRIEIMKTYLV